MKKQKPYPRIYEALESQLWGRGLRRYAKSQLCEPVSQSSVFQNELHNLEEHSPDAARLLRASLPRMASEVIQSKKRPIYIPAHYQQGPRKSRILCYQRLYLAYQSSSTFSTSVLKLLGRNKSLCQPHCIHRR
jgi:hypothetical protein